MEKSKISKIKFKNDPSNLIILFVLAVTLYFNSKYQDPFNLPKFLMVSVTGLWLLGYLLIQNRNRAERIDKSPNWLKIILILFLLSMLISSINSDNIYVAFLGESSRKNGFLLYLFFTVYMYICFKTFNFANVEKIFSATIFLLLILTIYGIFQSQGIDFVKWNNPYNSVILTMGNPNFASSLLAILAVLSFSYTFFLSKKRSIVILIYVLLLFTVFVIYLNGSLQGLISTFFGVSIFLTVYLFKKEKKLGIIYLVFFVMAIVFSILGVMQKGPLQELLYKDSVSVRGFYWRAAYQMFINNFWLGVGPDNYGNYFRFFREVEYPLRYGFEITSNNAHNVFLQFFATGGVFVGVFYMALVSYIYFKFLISIRKIRGKEMIMLTGVFSAWNSYLVQSMISIDNVGLAIWGWVLGGVVLGLVYRFQILESDLSKETFLSQINRLNPIRQMLSVAMLISVAVPVSYLVKGDSAMMTTRALFNPNANIQNASLASSIESTLEIPLLDPYYKLLCADILFRSGKPSEAKNIMSELLVKSPDSADLLSIAAYYNEVTGEIKTAVDLREKLTIQDPWNAKNYLRLASLYEAVGNINKAEQAYLKILEFARSTPDGEIASGKLSSL
jgi:O-antigen ligase